MARQVNSGDPGAGFPSQRLFNQNGTIVTADLTIADTLDNTKTIEFDAHLQAHDTTLTLQSGPILVDTTIQFPSSSGTLALASVAGPAFGIVQPITGTSPTASVASDTLTLVSGDSSVSIIGTAGTDTLDFRVASSYINSIGTIDSVSKSANGAVISSSALVLQSADATFPGLITAGTQTIAGTKTFTGRLNANGGVDRSTAGTLSIGTDSSTATTINIGNATATVNIQGSTIFENTTTLLVADPTIVLNRGGGAASAASSGITLEEGGSITGYTQTSGDRNSWTFKAPNTAGIVTLTPGSGGFTIDQASHNPVTLAAVGAVPNANGASLSSQVLNLQPADSSFPGVVTTGTQTFSGAKTFSSTITGSITGNSGNVTGVVALANGGTNANLTAVNGGITYSTASAMAISAAGTSGQVLTSGGAGAPTWTTSGTVSGLTSGRVTLSTGATSIGDSANLTFNSSTGDLLMTGSLPVLTIGTASTGTTNRINGADTTGRLVVAAGTTSANGAYLLLNGTSDSAPGTSAQGGAKFTIRDNGSAKFLLEKYDGASTFTTMFGATVSNNFVGVGAVSGVNPASIFHVGTSTTGNGVMTLEQSNGAADAFDINIRKGRGSVTTPTVITTADELGVINFQGYSGAGGFVTGAAIKAISEGTIATTRVPGHLSFWTGTDAAPTVLTERARISSAGNMSIGNTAPAAKLDITGSYYSRSQTLANNAASCDFSVSNNAQVTYTTGNAPGAFTLTNMQDGGVYRMVTIVGATIGTFAFAQSGLTFVYAPANTTVLSTTALYVFHRIGSNVYVTWFTGFV